MRIKAVYRTLMKLSLGRFASHAMFTLNNNKRKIVSKLPLTWDRTCGYPTAELVQKMLSDWYNLAGTIQLWFFRHFCLRPEAKVFFPDWWIGRMIWRVFSLRQSEFSAPEERGYDNRQANCKKTRKIKMLKISYFWICVKSEFEGWIKNDQTFS